jgi:hypothetical protein
MNKLWNRLVQWYYRKKAIRGLRRKYLLDIEIDRLMKDWVTACIIDRKQEGRRKELIDSNLAIKEKEMFIKWLNTK